MKSKTSFFNGTAFKKDLTRFAPLWGLYTLCLMLGLCLMAAGGVDYDLPHNIAACIQIMAVINCGYALLVAQLLFGDLYNSRMCNALHALPLRRECWFGTHIVSGLFFSIVPTALMTIAELVLVSFSTMVNGWQIPLYWMLAANLEYLFFFGVAVLCVFCTGNRVAMAILYAILNFASILAYYMVDIVYIPMLHGVIIQTAPYMLFSPVVQIIEEEFIDCSYYTEFSHYAADGSRVYSGYGTFEVTGEWWYLWVIASVGIALVAVALQMYRRRKLECAGDFMATKKLEPVFMVLFSLSAACVFQVVYQGYFGISYGTSGPFVVFLFVGLIAGWFAGRMLLERNVRVFRQPKNWLGMGTIVLALAASLFVVDMDPLGIEDWVPDADDVAKAYVTQGTWIREDISGAENMEDVIRIHALAVEKKLTEDEARADRDAAYAEYEEATREVAEDGTVRNDYSTAKLRDYERYTSIVITYDMKNGQRVQREYYLMIDSEEGELVKRYFSSEQFLIQNSMGILDGASLMALVEEPESINVEGIRLDEAYQTEEALEELYRAISADCAAGTMAQDRNFHKGMVFQEGEAKLFSYWVNINFGGDYNFGIDIYADAVNTIAWLENTGVLEEVHTEIAAAYG